MRKKIPLALTVCLTALLIAYSAFALNLFKTTAPQTNKDSLNTHEQQLTLVYSSNLKGEIEPCGCTMDTDYGGIPRRVTQLDELRKESPNLVLISSGNLFNTEASTKSIINRYIASGFALLDYDAIAVQSQDLQQINTSSNLTKLPWVGLNQPNRLDEQLITRNDQTLYFFSLNARANKTTTKALEKRLAKVDTHATTILSLEEGHQFEALLEKLIKAKLIDIVIEPKRDELFDEPKVVNKTLVLSPGNRGMRLGKLIFSSANPTTGFTHEVLALENSVVDSARTTQWYADYNQTLADFFTQDSATKSMENSPYAGEATCKTCHSEAHDTWANSRHGHALATLEKVGKTQDPNCIACHVVGYGDSGGYINQQRTPHLANVQCEACHGAGKAHAQSPLEAKPTKHSWQPVDTCLQCHVKDHSPKFNYDNYWPKIAH